MPSLLLVALFACDGDPLDSGTTLGVADADADDFAADVDCDDDDPTIHPGAAELCDDVDQDCDDVVDEDPTDATTWYPDLDGDSHGDGSSPVVACDAPADHLADGTDCDDASASVHPGADEVCDDLDQDCDDVVDESATDAGTWYTDDDGDGFGDPASGTASCEATSTQVADASDCDDTAATVYPWAGDTQGDGVDGDCDGLDGEGVGSGFDYLAVVPCSSCTWHDADADCRSSGYDGLASIAGDTNDGVIRDLAAGIRTDDHNIWIGYADEDGDGLWSWSDGTSYSYTNWSPGEPSGEGYAYKQYRPTDDHRWADATSSPAGFSIYAFACKVYLGP